MGQKGSKPAAATAASDAKAKQQQRAQADAQQDAEIAAYEAEVARMMKEADAAVSAHESHGGRGDAHRDDGNADGLDSTERMLLAELDGGEGAPKSKPKNPRRKEDAEGLGSRQNTGSDMELTDADLEDPALLRAIAQLEKQEVAANSAPQGPGGAAMTGGNTDDGSDDGSDADPLEKLTAEVEVLCDQAIEAADAGNEKDAQAAFEEARQLRISLQRDLGVNVEDPTPRLVIACLDARGAALVHNKSGDKPKALAALRRHKALKTALVAAGVEVPAK
jgi:hypothetical protein